MHGVDSLDLGADTGEYRVSFRLRYRNKKKKKKKKKKSSCRRASTRPSAWWLASASKDVVVECSRHKDEDNLLGALRARVDY